MNKILRLVCRQADFKKIVSIGFLTAFMAVFLSAGVSSAAAVTPITTAATSITSTSATLNGTVNPQGNNVMHRFGYNLAGAAVPTYTAWSLTVSGTTNLPARVSITGLSPGTAYYYFFQVYNSTTGSYAPNGLTESFTTTEVSYS